MKAFRSETASIYRQSRAVRQRLFASQYSASSRRARTLRAPPFHSACCSPSGRYRFCRGTLETETIMINFIEQLVAAPGPSFDGGSAEHGKKLISGSLRGRLTLRITLELPWSTTGTVDDFVTGALSFGHACNTGVGARRAMQDRLQNPPQRCDGKPGGLALRKLLNGL